MRSPRAGTGRSRPRPSAEPGKLQKLLYVTLPGCWGAVIIRKVRAASEYGWFLASRWWLAQGRSGADRPVLVVPGLDAADRSTKPLRSLLSSAGDHPYGWGLGRNVGPTERIITGLDELLLQIRDRHQAPVSVIGQSLGGLLGRELARRHPGAVDRLITLGSPVTITSLRQSRAGKAYLRHAGQHLPQFAFERWTKAPQPPIPSTSIYSRSDGIARWETCRCENLRSPRVVCAPTQRLLQRRAGSSSAMATLMPGSPTSPARQHARRGISTPTSQARKRWSMPSSSRSRTTCCTPDSGGTLTPMPRRTR